MKSLWSGFRLWSGFCMVCVAVCSWQVPAWGASICCAVQESGTVTVDDVLGVHLAAAEGCLPVQCDYVASVEICADENMLQNGGVVAGNVIGRMVRERQGGMNLYSADSVYKVRFHEPGNGQVGVFSPFPSAALSIWSDARVLYLSNATGSGLFGPLGEQYPLALFDPLLSLGTCASEKYADPVHWLVFREDGVVPEIQFEGNTAKVRGMLGPAVFETWFDMQRNAAVCYYSITGEDGSIADFRVLEFSDLENGRFFPLRALARYASDHEFPRRIIRWSASETKTGGTAEPVRAVIGYRGMQTPIYGPGALDKPAWLPPGAILTPGELEKIWLSLRDRPGQLVELPASAVWPAFPLQPGLPPMTSVVGAPAASLDEKRK